MTETADLPALSVQTAASVQGLVRAKNELEQWTKNLEQALADDVAATPPRLTHDEAAAVAKHYGVSVPHEEHKAPEHPAPAAASPSPAKPEHKETADTGHKASDEKAKKPATTR